MEQYVGLDVSLKETSICVLDGSGKVICEGKVSSDVGAIASFVERHAPAAACLGLETGPLTTWLWHGLRDRGLPAICICARHAKPFLKTQLNKTDRNDARGLAQLMRFGAFKEVHVKSLDSHAERGLLTGRALLVKVRRDVENQLRGQLKTFGLKLGEVSGGRFEGRVRELVGANDMLRAVVEPLLAVRAELRKRIAEMDRALSVAARRDPVCRLLMTADGVGKVVALGYKHTIEDPHRFRHSSSVGAYVGLTPRRFNSGEVDYTGRISKCGDTLLRSLLFEAAGVLLHRCAKPSALKAWGLRLARKIGLKKAKLAVARKLAVILHRMWVDGTSFRRTARVA
jgi:transposase